MTPADIEQHSAEAKHRLRDASYKRLDPAKFGGFDAYQADPHSAPKTIGPMTFAWAFAWTPQAEQQRKAWESIIYGFKVSLSLVYPDCGVAFSELQVGDGRQVPLILSQVYAKMRRGIRGPMVIVEADVVCNRRCDPFENDFDVGLTDCQDKWPMMPFNAGVIFAKDTPNAQRFFDAAMEYTCNIPQNYDPWYAYQFGLSHAYLALKDEVNIKIFPYEEYNYTPTVYAPTDAYFVHLKGQRKAMQRDYVLPLIEGQRGRLVLPA